MIKYVDLIDFKNDDNEIVEKIKLENNDKKEKSIKILLKLTIANLATNKL